MSISVRFVCLVALIGQIPWALAENELSPKAETFEENRPNESGAEHLPVFCHTVEPGTIEPKLEIDGSYFDTSFDAKDRDECEQAVTLLLRRGKFADEAGYVDTDKIEYSCVFVLRTDSELGDCRFQAKLLE